MGELNKRRGRVLGMNPAEKKGMTEIVAEVPMAEMADFTLLLRQMTQGQGVFTFEKHVTSRFLQILWQMLSQRTQWQIDFLE